MSPTRCLTVLVALVAGMVAVPPSYAEQPRPHTYRAHGTTPLETPKVHGRELTARVANLAAPANRAAGMPVPASAAYERFGTATFNMDFETGYVTVSGTLGAAPPSGDLPRLAVQAGVLNGTNCSGLAGELGGTFSTTGSVSDLDPIPAGWAGANCVLAVVLPNGSSTPSDALVGTLTDVVTYPVLNLGKPEILGVKKLKLVRGVWTPVTVEVFNSGTSQARAVTVTGKGQGIKVRPGSLGYGLAPADGGKPTSGTVDIRVKLTSKARKAKLTLMASSDGEAGTSKVTVKATKAPAPPKPGRYESKDGDVQFTISGGKVSGFRVRTQTQCGGFPGLPTYTMNTYDFPKTKISRAGIVHDHDEGELYGVNLEMLVSGSKVTRGRFSYSGPDRCFAVETFDAKRVKG
jgi:hypothetical protein